MNVDSASHWASSRPPGEHAKPKTIVVVEDDAIVAFDLAERLRQAGHEVPPPISSGEEAVEFILGQSAEPPDLVLMDIALGPGIDGIAAARRIMDGADVPVVYLTANSDANTMDEARLTNIFGYISKPFHERDLLMSVEIAIQRHEVEKEFAEATLARGEHPEGFLSICSYCDRIRDASDQWLGARIYLARRANVKLSHGICPSCHTTEFGHSESSDE
jgi:DNA-binding response OmpR family regulator